MDTYNNDAVSESDVDEIEPSKESHSAARDAILDKLKCGDKTLRESAINDLNDNETFWDSVFSIGANTQLSSPALINDSIRIGVDVFAAVAAEVYDLSLKMEKEARA